MSNNDESQQDSRRDASKQSSCCLMKLLMAGAMMVGAGAVGVEGRKILVPADQEAKEALRVVLKDPDKTNKLIHAITKEPAISDDFVNDPRVIQNLTKLANAMLEHSKRTPTRGTRSNNWSEKAAGPREESVLEVLFPHLRREGDEPKSPFRFR